MSIKISSKLNKLFKSFCTDKCFVFCFFSPQFKSKDKYQSEQHNYYFMPADDTGRFLLVGVSRVSSRRLVCGVSKTSFCSLAIVFCSFFVVIKHAWYYLVSSRRLVCGGHLKNYR